MTNTDAPTDRHFWHQEAAQRALFAARDRQRLATSYLLIGPEGVGKWAAAIWVAKALLCTSADAPCDSCAACNRVQHGTHPDLHLLFPVPRTDEEDHISTFIKAKREDPFAVVRFEKRPNLTVERVREVQSELSKTAVEGGKKVTIIGAADKMAPNVHGILLKSIEEPLPQTHFILTTADPGRIPSTIQSRCQTIRFMPVDPGIIESRLMDEGLAETQEAGIVAHLSNGGWGTAVQLCSEDAVAWRSEVRTLWDAAFQKGMSDFFERSDALFRSSKFDDVMQAFDVWSLLLWQDIRASLAGETAASRIRFSTPDQAWGCWKILQQGRSTLHVNVVARSAVRGTFLTLRERLNLN